MSSTFAAALTIGLILGIGLPIFYWIFYKMDDSMTAHLTEDEPPCNITIDDLRLIELELDVKLPGELKAILSNRSSSKIDNTTLLDNPRSIIEATVLYRNGFEGLSQWPKNLVYIGDEADTCPYAFNTSTLEVKRLDKGNLKNPPLFSYTSINEWITYMEEKA